MATLSSEQLNFIKFSTVVLDEFPAVLRRVFVYMWDHQVAPKTGFQLWDDSLQVRSLFLTMEGGRTKYVPTRESFTTWELGAPFEATLFAQSFGVLSRCGHRLTLADLYTRRRGLPSGTFHSSVKSPTGNQ